MVQRFWKQPVLSQALREGTAGFAPVRALIWVGASLVAVMTALSYPTWFIGRCVFLDDITRWYGNDSFVCSPYPIVRPATWLLVLFLSFTMAMGYIYLYRLSVRRGMATSRTTTYRLADGFALGCGLLIGWWWARGFTPNGEIVPWGSIVIVLTGPWCVWLWRTHLRLWMKAVAWFWLTDDEVAAVTARMLVQDHLSRATALEIGVTCAKGTLVVEGQFDAVDTQRIKDLLANHFPDQFDLDVRTTLSDDEYWRAYRSELTRSSYVSPPIREPVAVPSGVLAALGLTFLTLLVIALRYGPGLAPGISADDLAGFMRVQRVIAPTPSSPTPDPHVATVAEFHREHGAALFVAPAVAIDIAGSSEVCPVLERTATRMYRLDPEDMLGPHLDPGNPASSIRYGDVVVRIHYVSLVARYYVLVIERESGRCVAEHAFPTTAAAQQFGNAYPGVMPGIWNQIERDADWRYVPPRPPDKES